MTSQGLNGNLIKSYERFKFFPNNYPVGKRLENSFTKKASQSHGKVVKFSKKIQARKCDLSCKYMKNT